ncbi:plasmid pRiA4b ORF-3 family protein [Treponema pectinovorum]|uniref:plasmid pRiA4b ORF-3 family protein n=1 Tax=Treponema pectinovorum TaxID=164 RepID=UPI0011C8F0DE|nr:plasmid pRiA4b ORF-3 family protein [Treponema pectinovorum]
MIFRLTKNALDYINAAFDDDVAPKNRYLDWFVDIFIGADENDYFLLTNARSLFSVVIPAKNLTKKESFIKNAVAEIKSYFKHTDHSDLFSSFIEPNLEKTVITKTNSRTVLKTMRGKISRIPFIMNFLGLKQSQSDMFILSDRINTKPLKSQYAESALIVPSDFISSEVMRQPVPESPFIKQKKTDEKNVYKIKAQLCDFEKEIWREFIISQNTTMENLAFALMSMFNMDGSHMYRFEIDRQKQEEQKLSQKGLSQEIVLEMLKSVRNIEIECYADEQMNSADDDFMLKELGIQPPERFEAYSVKIIKFLNKENKEIDFFYDFGDGWKIKLTLEKADFPTDIPAASLPFVLEGMGLGIIEDCGGTDGLRAIKKAFKMKRGEDYEQYRDWLGRDKIDLTYFNAEEVNKRIVRQIKKFKKVFGNKMEE